MRALAMDIPAGSMNNSIYAVICNYDGGLLRLAYKVCLRENVNSWTIATCPVSGGWGCAVVCTRKRQEPVRQNHCHSSSQLPWHMCACFDLSSISVRLTSCLTVLFRTRRRRPLGIQWSQQSLSAYWRCLGECALRP